MALPQIHNWTPLLIFHNTAPETVINLSLWKKIYNNYNGEACLTPHFSSGAVSLADQRPELSQPRCPPGDKHTN